MPNIADLLRDINSTADPTSAYRVLLDHLLVRSSSNSGVIYVLHLRRGAFVPVTAIGRDIPRRGPTVRHQLSGKVDPRTDNPLASVVMTKSPRRYPSVDRNSENWAPGTTSAVILPAVRGRTCIALILLESSRAEHYSRDLVDELQSLMPLACTVYEHEFSTNAFRNMQQSIAYAGPERSFVRQQISLAERAGSLEFVALRELTSEGRLRTIDVSGFGNEPERRAFDLWRDRPGTEDFWDCVDTYEPIRVDSVVGTTREALWQFAPEVQSFVIAPILVGGQLFGVLSLAARCEYEYSKLEELAIVTIANGMGVSIENFRNATVAARRLADETSAMQAIAATELGREARHAARQAVDNSQWALRALSKGIRDRAPRSGLQERIVDLSSIFVSVSNALDQMRDAEGVTTREPYEISLEQAIDNSIQFHRARISAAGIDLRIDPAASRTTLFMDPGRLVRALTLLVQNSLDAFEARDHLDNREIRVDIVGDSGQQLEVAVSDTAGGLDVRALLAALDVIDRDAVDLDEAIFEPGLTTKREGSGHGLALARRNMRDLRGDVRLSPQPNEGGVTFVVSIPHAVVLRRDT